MPFVYSNQSVCHVPDVDINFGLGDRIQLTYESAWLRVQNPAAKTKFGERQSNPGVKWRFYDKGGDEGLKMSIFPQLFVDNPSNAVRRGVTPAAESLLLPVEFSKLLGPVDVDFEAGYQLVRHAPSPSEGDLKFYNQGPFHIADNQPTIGLGGRFKIHSPVIILFMAGRSLEPVRPNQSCFVGYFGLQFLLPPSSYNSN